MRPVIFDFNGTLYHDTGFHTKAWQRFFEEKMGVKYTEEEVHDLCIGPSNSDILRRLVDKDITEERIEALSKEKEELYRSTCRSKEENLRLVKGAEKVFDLLEAKGVPFVLATSSGIDNIMFYLNDLGLKKWFDMDRIVYEDGSVASKPDPAFYTAAAARVGAKPEACIVVEDSPTGIRGAMNAGVKDVIIRTGTMTEKQLAEFPQLTNRISDFTEFETVLEQLGAFE